MTYRVYLRTFDGQISENTITKNQDTAADAFTSLVCRADLERQKLAVALTYNNRLLAFHRFDRNPGDSNYWCNKLDEIEWPSAGRPAEMDGGKRVNVYLDTESLSIAAKLGDGNVSDGIRKALKQSEL